MPEEEPISAESAAQKAAAKAALWKSLAEAKRRQQAQAQQEPSSADLGLDPAASQSKSASRPASASGWNDLYESTWDELQHLSLPQVQEGAAQKAPQAPALETSEGEAQPPSPAPIRTPRRTTIRIGSPMPPMEDAAPRDSKDSPQEASPQTASPKPPPPAAPIPHAAIGRLPEHEDATAVHRLLERLQRHVPAFLLPYWRAWGGESLLLSLIIHLVIIGFGAFLVVNSDLMQREVDFLPGGSVQGEAASEQLRQKVNQKRSPWLRKPMPMRKIAANSDSAALQLPDAPLDLPDLPESSLLNAPSRLGPGAGGSGGGFGKAMGLGAANGMVFQPLSMFGREIKAKRLAVVLDVSSSMTPFLPRVLDEVDRFAKGSIVVLFPGCGLANPPKGGMQGDDLFRTSTEAFERFWRLGAMATYDEARKMRLVRSEAIPSESLFRYLSRRPQTHFVHGVGTSYAWVALLSEAVRQADAIYWFSDFQDVVDFAQLDVVRENLLRRRQRLYIHPYQHGSSFDLIRNQLVEPTKGEVIESPFE